MSGAGTGAKIALLAVITLFVVGIFAVGLAYALNGFPMTRRRWTGGIPATGTKPKPTPKKQVGGQNLAVAGGGACDSGYITSLATIPSAFLQNSTQGGGTPTSNDNNGNAVQNNTYVNFTSNGSMTFSPPLTNVPGGAGVQFNGATPFNLSFGGCPINKSNYVDLLVS